MNASARVARLMLLATIAAAPQPGIAASQCVTYGTASLVGTFVRQTYAGPPDYESVTKGDEPRVIWVLQLEERACVYSYSYTSTYGEREVQLVLDSDQYAHYEDFLGKRLIVTGNLIRGGAKHEKRLVLIVSEMQKATTANSSAYSSYAHSYSYRCRC